MNKFTSTLAGIFLFLILLQPQFSHAQHSFDEEKLDHYLTTLEEYDKFMGSVAILEDDEILFQKAYGFVNEDEQPADSETVYRIGSITKTFTSVILMKLVEEGELELSDHLSVFYPEIPNAEKITIEQLLYHRSGLVSVTSVDEYWDYYTKKTTREEMLERMIDYGIFFEPGEKFEYSNSGYILLGYIIEDVTGMSYADALKTYIADPLGLERTYYGGEISMSRGEAHSFTYNPDGWEQSEETHMSNPHGAGAISSTPAETGIFFNALFDGKLVSAESLETMKRLKDGYGFGIMRIPFNDKFSWGHNGGIDQFQSTAGHFPEDDLTVVLLGNGYNYSMNEIAIGILSIVFSREFEIPDFSSDPKQIELKKRELRAYTGSYSSKQIPLEIEVFLDGKVLKAQATGQSAIPLTAFEGGVMKFVPAGVTMVFDEKANGKYQSFELQQGGQNFSFSRKDE